MVSNVDKGGYDVEFVDNGPNELTCSICLFVLKEPMQAEQCGHRFCKSCIEDLRNSKSGVLICPEDRNEVNVFNDRGKEREILNLLVRCSNNKKGCEWTNALRELKDHIEVCEYQLIQCTNTDCHENLQKKLMKNHLEMECAYRNIECEFCCMKYEYLNQEEHMLVCEKYPLECEICKTGNIPRSQMQNHETKKCPERLHSCEYADIGCEEKLLLEALPFHGENFAEAHIKCAVKRIREQSDEIKNQAAVIEEKRQKIELQDASIKSQDATIKSQEVSIKSQEASIKSQEASIKALNTQLTYIFQRLDGLEDKGTFLWKIDNFKKKFQGSKKRNSANDRIFFALEHYKCRAQVYLNGEGDAEGTHVSIYFSLEEGPFDDALTWPMEARFSYSAVKDDQVMFEDVLDTTNTFFEKESFQRPRHGSNDGFGHQNFISHQDLIDYVVINDTITFKVSIEPL